jgi:hypothetical protein
MVESIWEPALKQPDMKTVVVDLLDWAQSKPSPHRRIQYVRMLVDVSADAAQELWFGPPKLTA